MPPKKQQQQNSHQYVPFYVLPVFLLEFTMSEAQKILRNKQINIKKCIDQNKIVEILKQKGLSQYINNQSQIGIEGRKFICENIKIVLQDFISQITKPVDSKKDVGKKDNKKDSKKQEVPIDANKQPILDLNLQKKCNDFFIYLDFPKSIQQLRISVQNGLKLDALVIIQEKIKKGSNIPNYDLLGRSLQQNDLMKTLNLTQIEDSKKGNLSFTKDSYLRVQKKIIKQVKKLKNENQSFTDLVIVQIPYEKDIGHPQNDEMNFINNFFGKLSEMSREKENYENWLKTSVKQSSMIQPLKEIVNKQVQVQNQDKKGKKDANKQVQYTTVQQIIEKKYESLPQHIKSNLEEFKELQLISQNNFKSKDTIRKILQGCLQGIELLYEKTKPSSSFQINPQKVFQTFKSKPLVKPTFIHSLRQNLRQVKSFSQQNLSYNLIHSSIQINNPVSLSQITRQDVQNKQNLQFQFIIKTFTEFMNEQQPRIKMNFSDRCYRQKLSKNQVLSAIQNQLLKDPKIYEGDLNNNRIKLLCLARINPPGRVLYFNNIFEPKAVPNFQNWFKDYREKLNNKDQQQFYDYKFQEVGNLSIKKQISTPSDNVSICDQKITIGSQQNKVIHLSKFDCSYGIRKLAFDNNEFWLYNSKQELSVNIFQNQRQFKKVAKITQNINIQGSYQIETVQTQTESIQFHKRVELWIRTQNFIVSNTPYPSIMWFNQSRNAFNQQIRRQFGPKGEITTYLSDGSVKIFYLNGNVSSFRNNKWEKIIDGQLISSDSNIRKLTVKITTQGDKVIKIRQDQTIFIQFSNGNKLTAFQDGTKIFFNKKQNIYQIRNVHSYLREEIIVKITMPRTKDFNVIGHGSAFSYLGFKNIIQRSYDGFLYQIWHNKFSSHLYNEKYEFQNKIYEEQIRLLYLSDGSLLKMEGQQHVILIQGDNENSQQKLRYKWDQAFTIEQNHEQGVYDIHLNQGTIKTKDAQSNKFKINVEQENEINIAVSFKINDEDQVCNEFGNGFHVPEQNFFLPAPSNSLLPRIFSFNNNTNQYFEYLSEEQVRQMKLSSSLYHQEQTVVGDKIIKQYTREIKYKDQFDQSIKITSFSQPPSRKNFDLPSELLPKETKVNLDVQNNKIEFRILQKIQWDRDFNNIQTIEQKIKTKKELRQNQLKSFLKPT